MMVRLDAQNVPAKKIGLLFFAASILIQHGTSGQRVKVDAELPSYPGQTVNLRCSFSDPTGIQLTMVSWRYEANDGKSMNIAVYHPSYGPNYPASPLKDRVHFKPDPPELSSPSIEITDVKMTDEGKYICEYATYPDGNDQGTTKLVMLAKPENSASVVRVNADTQEVVVARCESKDGRPEAKIRWVTTANGNSTEKSQKGADDTVTVTSEYRMVPTSMDNGKDITCLVDHRTQIKPESFPMKLAIQFPPKVEIKGYDNNWYVGRTNAVLICEATGNPLPVSVTWRTMSGEMPDTVQVLSNKLKVLKVDDSVNTTFICEVKNRIGTTRDQLAIFVREPSKSDSNAGVVAGAVIGSLLALLLVAALVTVLITRSRRQQRGYRANGASDMKTRIFGGGKKASKNGTSGGPGSGGVAGGNNNGPVYIDRSPNQGLGEKNNHQQPFAMGARPEVVTGTLTAEDILLRSELDEAERRKFDEMDDDERYDNFSGEGPILQLRPPPDQDDMIGDYMDDDMESQRDGSVISRTAVYV